MELINRDPCCEKPVQCGDESVTARLMRRKLQLSYELKEVNDAIELLNSVPDIGKVLDAISRVGRY